MFSIDSYYWKKRLSKHERDLSCESIHISADHRKKNNFICKKLIKICPL